MDDQQSSKDGDLLQCPQVVVEIFNKMNASECLEALVWAYGAMARFDEPIKDCIHFEFLKNERLDELFKRDQEFASDYFWTQIGQLLIIVARTAPHALMRLIDGIMSAVSGKNELLLALALRAWQEQISSLFDMTETIKSHQERLAQVWGSSNECIRKQTPTDKDLRSKLIRYVLGHKN